MGTNSRIANSEGRVVNTRYSPPLEAPRQDQALKRACREFESCFLLQLWRAMRATVPTEARSTPYVEMFDMNFADYLSRVGRFELGEMLYQQLAPGLPILGMMPEPSQLEEGIEK